MNELIESIRVAVATEASAEQKLAGAQACRTILAALDTEPGKPFLLPGMPMPATTFTALMSKSTRCSISRSRRA